MNPKPPPNQQSLGSRGEQLAKNHLQNKGYHFLTQNFHSRYGEIDLIFSHHNQIIFVEVKARNSDRFGVPEEAVTLSKLKKIITTANYYLTLHHLHHLKSRIDLIAISNLDSNPQINHIQNLSS